MTVFFVSPCMLLFLLQNNDHCREKQDYYISLHKIQSRAMVLNFSLSVDSHSCI